MITFLRRPTTEAIENQPRLATTWGRSIVVRIPAGASHTNGTALTARLAE